MRRGTTSVDTKQKNVPTAKLIKHAERKFAGRPSQERQRRAHSRLKKGSPFTRDDV